MSTMPTMSDRPIMYIVQGVPNRISLTWSRSIATLNKSKGEHVDLFSVAIVRNCNPKKFLGAGDSIRNFFWGILYIPSHCTPALLKAWSDTECSPCCGRRSRGCPPQSHSRRSRCPGFLSVWRSNLFWNWSSSLSPLWLFLCWKYKYEAQKTVVLNQMISLHLGDVQKSSLVKVDPKPEVFAAVKGTRLKCRVVPKKVIWWCSYF